MPEPKYVNAMGACTITGGMKLISKAMQKSKKTMTKF
jgi:NADH:ubiquinone oxidoreductase subunit B-like Fe-S oxidoreductase